MNVTPLSIPGAYLIEPAPAQDHRGHFTKLFDATRFQAWGLRTHWEQECVSYNTEAGTLRGLHHQASPLLETKLIRCTRGSIYDVFVDLRPDSPTYLRWEAVELGPDRWQCLYIPAGCSHGYQALEDHTTVHYLISVPYHADLQRGIRWDDPTLAIPWPLRSRVKVSPRDATLPSLEQATLPKEAPPLLAFDLGSNDGADTAYLLAKGYRVVAVEADPALASGLEHRFAPSVALGRLAVEAAAVAEGHGTVDFFLSSLNTHWSSCSEDKASFGGGTTTRVSVPIRSYGDLIRRHGHPALVKADIEGQETSLLRQMAVLPEAPRPYLVVELSKETAWEIFEGATRLGYSVCKLVNQIHSPGVRTVRTLAGEDIPFSFTSASAGPMDDDLESDNWISIEEAARRYKAFREIRALDPRHLTPGWLDLHLLPPGVSR